MIVAVVQARMGSSRLSGKVMADINGKPVLWHVINRLKDSKLVDDIFVATTKREEDKVIVKLAVDFKLGCFKGSENDVLKRIYETISLIRHSSRGRKIDGIVRITGDCPMIDPRIVDKVINYYLVGGFDYVSNCTDYAFGLDVEVFSYEALRKANRNAKTPYDREHVTSYMYSNLGEFLVGKAPYNIPKGEYGFWAIDTADDLEFVREVFSKLGNNFRMEDVLKELEK